MNQDASLKNCPAGKEHIWIQWKFLEKDSCKQSRSCFQCHEIEEREVHDWIVTSKTEIDDVWWGDNSRRILTYQIYECTRCGKPKRVLIDDRA